MEDGVAKIGTYRYEDGTRYIGDWSNKGLKNGAGSLLLPDGTRYDGSFQNGLCSGLGIYIFPDGAKSPTDVIDTEKEEDSEEAIQLEDMRSDEEDKEKEIDVMEERMCKMGMIKEIYVKMETLDIINRKLDGLDKETKLFRAEIKMVERKVWKLEESKASKTELKDGLGKVEEKMDELEGEMGATRKEVVGILDRLVENGNKMESLEKEVTEKIKVNNKEEQGGEQVEDEKKKQTKLQKERVKKEIEWLLEEKETDRLKKNIVIEGLDIKKFGDKKELESWIKMKLEVNVKITKTWIVKGRKEKLGAQCRSIEGKE